MNRIQRFAFAALLSVGGVPSALAQVEVHVERVPADGLVVTHVDLTAAAAWCKLKVEPSGVKARLAGKEIPVQFVPDADFDSLKNAAGMLVAKFPPETGGKLELVFTAAPPAENAWDGRVKLPSATVVHDARRQAGLPCEIQFTDGKRFNSIHWNDRLHHREVGGANLTNDPQAKVVLVSRGPLCTAVRVAARFLHAKGKAPASAPEAVYDWLYLNDRPAVFVQATVTQKEPFAWNEIHFLELDYPREAFPQWVGGEPRKAGDFKGTKEVTHAAAWGAILDGPRAIGMFQCGRVMFYDGGPGTYIQSHGDAAWQGFDQTRRRQSGWLWIGSDPHAADAIAALAKSFTPPQVTVTVRELRERLEQLAGAQLGVRRWQLAGARQLERQGRLRAALETAAGRKPGNWTIVAAGDLAMILERTSAGIELLTLYDAAAADSMLAATRCPLFEVNLKSVAAKESLRLSADAGWDDCAITASAAADRAELRWRRTADRRLAGLSVVARVNADRDGAFRWMFAVEGVPADWGVVSARFPQLALAEPGPQSSVLFPRGSGEVRSDAWRRGGKLGGVYPSGWTSMPLLAVYDKAGKTGLYFAVHDPWGSTKEVYGESQPAEQAVRLWFEHPAANAGAGGNGFALSGEAVWRVLRGNWFDAALVYRDWVRRNARWHPQLGPDGRADTPLWMRELSAWAQTGGSPKECVEKVKEFARFLGVPVGFHWYSWHQIPFDNDYPHYFPTQPGFAEAVRELQATGVYVMPYINGRLWDIRDQGLADFQFTRVALPAATKDEHGKPWLEMYGSKERDGSRVQLAAMCPATPLWQQKIHEIALRLFNEQGVKGVYIDQVAAAQPRLCFDRTHGHPLAGGHWWTESYWAMLEAIRRAKPADCMLTTECNAEPYTQVFDGYLTWHWQYDGQVPLFPAVYGGSIQMFGRAYRAGPTKDLALRMKAGQQLVWGEQIGWLSPHVIREKQNGEFLRQAVRLRHALRRYFYAGEMARPPRIDGPIPRVTADWQWSGVWPVTDDALQAAAWQIPAEKRLVLMFVNVGDEPIEGTLDFDAARYGLPDGPLTMTRVTAEGAGAAQPIARKLRRLFTAAPHEAWAWEITPARSVAAAKPWHVTLVEPAKGRVYPPGTQRITYASGFDGAEDWALFLPGDPSRNTIVYLHGSFSQGDQIFTRKDVREFWLTRIQAGRHPLLSINMRGTSYMSPAATADLTDLLAHCRTKLGCQRFVLLGGSGGASSAMAYAVLHPEQLHGVVAMGMCDIFARLDFARKSDNPTLKRLAATAFAAYGGTPEERPELYRARSVMAHIDRLNMPVILTMGEADALIPVAETRKIAAAMRGKNNFVYHEVPQGNHDSAVWVDIDLERLRIRP